MTTPFLASKGGESHSLPRLPSAPQVAFSRAGDLAGPRPSGELVRPLRLFLTCPLALQRASADLAQFLNLKSRLCPEPCDSVLLLVVTKEAAKPQWKKPKKKKEKPKHIIFVSSDEDEPAPPAPPAPPAHNGPVHTYFSDSD